jgi:hypothetical protein
VDHVANAPAESTAATARASGQLKGLDARTSRDSGSNLKSGEHVMKQPDNLLGATTRDPDEDILALVRLDPSQLEATVKIPLTLQCNKPLRHDFIRVHPVHQIAVGGIELKDEEDGGLFIVTPELASDLGDEVKSFLLRPYINRGGILRLWQIRLPGPDGKLNEWHRTAAVAADLATRKWIRVAANKALGAYEVFEAANQPPDPEWPDLSLADMIRLAFSDRGRLVRDPDHPLIKRLLGSL